MWPECNAQTRGPRRADVWLFAWGTDGQRECAAAAPVYVGTHSSARDPGPGVSAASYAGPLAMEPAPALPLSRPRTRLLVRSLYPVFPAAIAGNGAPQPRPMFQRSACHARLSRAGREGAVCSTAVIRRFESACSHSDYVVPVGEPDPGLAVSSFPQPFASDR